jgi:hypothetical protein
LATNTKYLDEKMYHYCNKAGEDMVELHTDWLYIYKEDEKVLNGIPPLPKYSHNLSARKPEMSSHVYILVRTKLFSGQVS